MKEFLNENLINIVWAVSIILIVWLLIFFSMKKEEKIEKLKSWKTPSIKIDWIVKEIKYNQSRDWNIFWYFIAQGNNLIKNKITNFRSQDFVYGDSSVINFMGRPNKEKEKKLFEYARSLIKEWDVVKIYISAENSNIYYIRDFRSEDEFVLDAPIWSLNEMKELDKIDMDKIQDIIGRRCSTGVQSCIFQSVIRKRSGSAELISSLVWTFIHHFLFLYFARSKTLKVREMSVESMA